MSFKLNFISSSAKPLQKSSTISKILSLTSGFNALESTSHSLGFSVSCFSGASQSRSFFLSSDSFFDVSAVKVLTIDLSCIAADIISLMSLFVKPNRVHISFAMASIVTCRSNASAYSMATSQPFNALPGLLPAVVEQRFIISCVK